MNATAIRHTLQLLETVETDDGRDVLSWSGLYEALSLHNLALITAVAIGDTPGYQRYVPLVRLGAVARHAFIKDLHEYAHGDRGSDPTNAYVDVYAGELAILIT